MSLLAACARLRGASPRRERQPVSSVASLAGGAAASFLSLLLDPKPVGAVGASGFMAAGACRKTIDARRGFLPAR